MSSSQRPRESRPLEAGRVIGDKYRLERRLAEGGMGAVWVARHEVLEVDVAVKFMSSEVLGTELALARFEREAKASAKLKSSHIVRVHDYGVDDGTPYMVMELLDGEDLGQRLQSRGAMSPAELLPIFQQIAKGLEVAHEAGFVHRDLKPSNVFIAREGGEEIVKLVDFGVARETKTNLVEDKTTSGVVVGSPHHMSPEQALGERVDHRSDLWSLGVIAYRALVGKRPFDADVLATLLLEIVTQPIPKATEDNPALPPDADRFFSRALNRKPERRFQSAEAMTRALAALAEGEDMAPFLTIPSSPSGEEQPFAREDPTVPSGRSLSRHEVEPRSERTASREVGAVTAGLPSEITTVRSRPAWMGIALGAVVIAGAAFYLGRSGGEARPEVAAPIGNGTEGAADDAASEPTEPPPNDETKTPEAGPSARPETSVRPTPEAVPSSSASASTSVTARPAPRPRPVARPRPTPVAPKPAPKPTPKIDPFTGLPTP